MIFRVTILKPCVFAPDHVSITLMVSLSNECLKTVTVVSAASRSDVESFF